MHIVGGVHPEHDLYYYVEMIRRVKAILPEATVKAFTAIELSYMIRKAGLTIDEGLRLLRSAGMEAIPGGVPKFSTRSCVPESVPIKVRP